MRILAIGFICAVIFLLSSLIHEGYSQYRNEEIVVKERELHDLVEITLQDFLDTEFLQNESIIKDSIKTRISYSLRELPFGHVRIMYDVFMNNETRNIDSIYEFDFSPNRIYPENVNLVKILETNYQPPNKMKNSEISEDDRINHRYQNIMCRQGFEKVTKQSKEEVCVKVESIGRLFDRGWINIDYSTAIILKNLNYDSLRVPITVTYENPDTLLPKYSYISTKIWNLRNSTVDYSVRAFYPTGEEVINCNFLKPQRSHEPYSVENWKVFLHYCDHPIVLGNYEVKVVSNLVNETFNVNVDK
jgi:hypothetical protein